MVDKEGAKPRAGEPEYRDRIHTKPLPDILDEMEANILAAAEAARKAEEVRSRELLPPLRKKHILRLAGW